MFFTNAGAVIAWICAIMGFMGLLAGYEVRFNGTASIFSDMLSFSTAQKAHVQGKVFISQGSAMLFCGLVLGVLTEISRSLAARNDNEE